MTSSDRIIYETLEEKHFKEKKFRLNTQHIFYLKEESKENEIAFDVSFWKFKEQLFWKIIKIGNKCQKLRIERNIKLKY